MEKLLKRHPLEPEVIGITPAFKEVGVDLGRTGWLFKWACVTAAEIQSTSPPLRRSVRDREGWEGFLEVTEL